MMLTTVQNKWFCIKIIHQLISLILVKSQVIYQRSRYCNGITRSLGSVSQMKDIFLAGETINLGGATISSDGTGSIASQNGLRLSCIKQVTINLLLYQQVQLGLQDKIRVVLFFISRWLIKYKF